MKAITTILITFIILLFVMVFCASECRGACPNDTNYVWTYIVYTEHELVYEVDTVDCTYKSKVGSMWYLKGEDGIDYWSDKPPYLLRRRLACPW